MAGLEKMRRWIVGKMDPEYVQLEERIWCHTYQWDSDASNDYELWMEEADQQAVVDAIELLESNPAEGINELRALAENGSFWAMKRLGYCYQNGEGVERDLYQAEVWYWKAVSAGSWSATLDRARLLAKQDRYVEAEEVLTEGLEKDFVPAFFWTAWYRLKQNKSRKTCISIRPMLQHAADQGSPAAQWVLCKFMAKGRFGWRKIRKGIRLHSQMLDRYRETGSVEESPSPERNSKDS